MTKPIFDNNNNKLKTTRTKLRHRLLNILGIINTENQSANQVNDELVDDNDSEISDSIEKIENKMKNKKDKNNEELMTLVLSDHYYTFQRNIDLFTLLYSSIIFKWLCSERLIIIVDSVETGYKIEIFLRNFKINAVYLDPNNPINTNIHFAAQYIKGVFPVLIVHNEYNTKSKSPQFALEVVDECLIQPAIIFFNVTNPYLLEDHSCKERVKGVYHFLDNSFREVFTEDYATVCRDIKFINYSYDEEQFKHLKYRCEDIFHQIRKSDIKKTKLKKINQELLHSKAMKSYFDSNPDEKDRVIKTINENSIKKYRPSVGFLPSYLVHEEQKNNVVQSAIEESYFVGKKRKKQNSKYTKKDDEKDEDNSEEEKSKSNEIAIQEESD